MITRQFIVTHLKSGEVTIVSVDLRKWGRGESQPSPEAISRSLGYRYPADCTVRVLKERDEFDLPFDEIPLIIKRGVFT